MTAYQVGCDTTCTVSCLLRSVSDSPDLRSRAKSNVLVAGPRIGRGNDSVTRMRRASTGRKLSSPSDVLPVEPTALYVKTPRSSGTFSFQAYERDSRAGISKLRVTSVL